MQSYIWSFRINSKCFCFSWQSCLCWPLLPPTFPLNPDKHLDDVVLLCVCLAKHFPLFTQNLGHTTEVVALSLQCRLKILYLLVSLLLAFTEIIYIYKNQSLWFWRSYSMAQKSLNRLKLSPQATVFLLSLLVLEAENKHVGAKEGELRHLLCSCQPLLAQLLHQVPCVLLLWLIGQLPFTARQLFLLQLKL